MGHTEQGVGGLYRGKKEREETILKDPPASEQELGATKMRRDMLVELSVEEWESTEHAHILNMCFGK